MRSTSRSAARLLAATTRLQAFVPLFTLPLALVGLSPVLEAHEIITTRLTWTEHISRIFFRHCVSCHREGGPAPMPLLSYEQVRPWAKAIKYEVLSRRMPPWGAVKGYGAFRNDLSLPQEDIARISSWVEGGAPRGNPIYLPKNPSAGSYAPPERWQGETILLEGMLTFEKDTVAVGVRPERVAEGGSMEVRAQRPDGSVEPLIWLRDYRAAWRRNYYFREPIELPAGTRLMVFPSGEVSAELLLGGSGGAEGEQPLTPPR